MVVSFDFQTGLLAHGGFSTLGANSFSMAIVGPIVSFSLYKLLYKKNKSLAVFLAASLGNMTTYIVTSAQLGFANPSETGGVMESFIKFAMIFAITQIPLALIEGLLTNVIINILDKYEVKQEVRI